jgi:hypothetical protein
MVNDKISAIQGWKQTPKQLTIHIIKMISEILITLKSGKIIVAQELDYICLVGDLNPIGLTPTRW